MSTATLTAPPVATMNDAIEAIQRGNLQKADLICRTALQQNPGNVAALQVLAIIAQRIGDQGFAHQYDALARALKPEVESVLNPELPAEPVRAGTPRYLLIKAWGFGFWSDMDHLYGCLLLAELTGSIPVVQWGKNCLFRAPDTSNAFECYFEPVSGVSLDDLKAPDLSFFPGKWRPENLMQDDVLKWKGPGSRMTGMYALHRPENVVVCDFHVKLNDLMHWIPPSSPLAGLDRNALYRHLVQKYIRLKPHLTKKVDAWYRKHMANRPWLAVHMRGTDKVLEVGHLDQLNNAYESRIKRILDVNPGLNIFLMTDSEHLLKDFKQRYGHKVIHTDCQRGKGQQGVHLEGHPGISMGEQVILDAYLASRCDFFLGNGASNVSTAIRHLKHWQKGTFFVVGPDFLGETDLSLHEW